MFINQIRRQKKKSTSTESNAFSLEISTIKKKIKKTFILTIVLVLLGFALLIWGLITILAVEADHYTRGISMLVIGVLLFLPGGYQAHHIYKALNKVPGYRFENFDNFEEA